MPRCALHDVTFYAPHGSAGSVYTCPACGLRIDLCLHMGSDGAVTVLVHPPRRWLAQLFFDLARWLEG